MKDLQHECRHAVIGLRARIPAHRRASNDRLAEKEWQTILADLKRIEDALAVHYEKVKGGDG